MKHILQSIYTCLFCTDLSEKEASQSLDPDQAVTYGAQTRSFEQEDDSEGLLASSQQVPTPELKRKDFTMIRLGYKVTTVVFKSGEKVSEVVRQVIAKFGTTTPIRFYLKNSNPDIEWRSEVSVAIKDLGFQLQSAAITHEKIAERNAKDIQYFDITNKMGNWEI
ncbi:MAG: hypothetical protein VXW87_02470 [Pseudomonadota bacterium]|nr:hypothetical protein [Pseudomonadota bacterium]